MRKSKWFFVFLIVFFGIAFSAPYTSAEPLGYAQPLDWAGSGARINTWDSNGLFNYVSDISFVANTTTHAEHYSGMMGGWSESNAYVLKGYISSGEPEDQQAGGYFRDELYFETYNGQPAELALTFSIHASGSVQEIGEWVYNDATDEYDWVVTGSGYAWLNLGLNVPMAPIADPINWYYLSNQFLVYATTAGGFETISDVTLKSTDWDASYLVQSGTYLPFTIGLWGTVNNATLDWGNTLELVGVQAFQGGQALNNSQFTILSHNNEDYFSDFAHETPTNAIPEPTSLLLLGSGLGMIGVAAWRRRK